MATAPALMTMEQYLRTSFHPDGDFVDGEIEERYVGERHHCRAQGFIYAWFLARESSFSLEPLLEQRMLVAGNRARVCDVSLVRHELPDEQVTTAPPLVCIEIMSPEDRLSRAIEVLKDYRAMGVPNIWLVDPQERLAYTFGQLGLVQQADLVLNVIDSTVAFDVNELFAELERRRNKENE